MYRDLGIGKGSLRRDDRGAVVVEMAIAIPVFLAIGLGALEFANYFFNYQLIQNGVRDAARFASSSRYSPADNSAVIAQAKNIAVKGNPAGTGTSRVSFWSTANVTVSYTTVPNVPQASGLSSYRYSGDVPIVTVSTIVNYPSLGFLGFLNLGAITMRASHQERVIGVR